MVRACCAKFFISISDPLALPGRWCDPQMKSSSMNSSTDTISWIELVPNTICGMDSVDVASPGMISVGMIARFEVRSRETSVCKVGARSQASGGGLGGGAGRCEGRSRPARSSSTPVTEVRVDSRSKRTSTTFAASSSVRRRRRRQRQRRQSQQQQQQSRRAPKIPPMRTPV